MKQSIVELIELVRDSGGVMVAMLPEEAATLPDKLSRIKHAMGETDWRISCKQIPAIRGDKYARVRVERRAKVSDEVINVESLTILEEGL